MARQPRRRYFVDPKLQAVLVFRAFTYWLWCFVGMTLFLLCWRIVTGPARYFYTHFDEMWFYYAPAVIAGVFLLPLILYDTVRITNRFAGPVVRLRRCMRQLRKASASSRSSSARAISGRSSPTSSTPCWCGCRATLPRSPPKPSPRKFPKSRLP